MTTTDRDAIERAHRRARAVELRATGYTVREIAEELGIAVGTAWADLDTALKDVPAENVEELRQIELARLDALQRAVWDAAIAGGLAAVDRAVKIIAQRCRLMGLDAPQQIAVSGAADMDLDAAVRDLIAAATGPVEEGTVWGDYMDRLAGEHAEEGRDDEA